MNEEQPHRNGYVLKTGAPLAPGMQADRHPALVYIARLAPGSRRTMRGALDTIARILTEGTRDAETLEWGAIRYQHGQAVRTALADRYSPATTNKHLAALRGVLKEAWRLGRISADDYRRAADLESVNGSTLPRGRGLDAGELRALFESCDASRPSGARDAALLALLYGAGLRRAELVALDLEHYRTGMIRVHGKGNKTREAHLAPTGQAAVEAWVEHRGTDPGPLLMPVRKGEQIEQRRLSAHAIYTRLRRIADRAGVASFSPHDLRRSFVSDLLDVGADVGSVQRLAGHASVQTTLRYDRRPEAAKSRAAGLLHIPFQRRKGGAIE